MKTKNNDGNAIESKGLEIVLKCDKKVKEERIQCVIENRLGNISAVGNVVMKCRR